MLPSKGLEVAYITVLLYACSLNQLGGLYGLYVNISFPCSIYHSIENFTMMNGALSHPYVLQTSSTGLLIETSYGVLL